MQYRHFSSINTYNDVRSTFETLIEQRNEAGLGAIWAMETKSSLELKYGPQRAAQTRLVVLGVLSFEYRINGTFE